MTGAFSSALSGAASAEASPASTPETPSTPADSSPVAATAQPAEETKAPESVSPEQQKGEPPAWRWQDILANTRKEHDELGYKRGREEVEQQYADLKGFSSLSAEERNGLLIWQAALSGNQQAIAHIRANQQALAALRGMVAEDQKPDPEPAPDYELPVKDANGNVVGYRQIYSAEQQAKREAWLKTQWLGDVRKELQPLKQSHEELQQQRQAESYKGTVAGVIAQIADKDPEFAKHKAEVGKVISGDPRLIKLAIDQNDPQTAIELAWHRVYREQVLPAQKSSSEAQVLANLQQKAVAGTVSPGATTVANPKKFSASEQGFAEAIAHFDR